MLDNKIKTDAAVAKLPSDGLCGDISYAMWKRRRAMQDHQQPRERPAFFQPS